MAEPGLWALTKSRKGSNSNTLRALGTKEIRPFEGDWMNEQKLSRRKFLQNAATLSILTAGGAVVLAGCKSDDKKGGGKKGGKDGGKKPAAALKCDDVSGLDDGGKATRTANAYVEKSTKGGQSCDNCQLYVAAPSADKCGTCTVVKGPINPRGWCKLWVKKS